MTYKAVVSTYTVVVNNGTGDGIYKAGDTVTITADPPEEGMRFKNWERVEGFFNFKNSKSGTTTFTMPAGEVEVTAIYEERGEIHKVIVNNGSIENPSEDGYYSPGEYITLIADPPEEGKQVYFWSWIDEEGN